MVSINSRKLSLLYRNKSKCWHNLSDEIINSIRVASPRYLFLTYSYLYFYEYHSAAIFWYSGRHAQERRSTSLPGPGAASSQLCQHLLLETHQEQHGPYHHFCWRHSRPWPGNHKQKVNIPFHTSHSWIMCSWGEHSRRCLWRVMYWPRHREDVNLTFSVVAEGN